MSLLLSWYWWCRIVFEKQSRVSFCEKYTFSERTVGLSASCHIKLIFFHSLLLSYALFSWTATVMLHPNWFFARLQLSERSIHKLPFYFLVSLGYLPKKQIFLSSIILFLSASLLSSLSEFYSRFFSAVSIQTLLKYFIFRMNYCPAWLLLPPSFHHLISCLMTSMESHCSSCVEH